MFTYSFVDHMDDLVMEGSPDIALVTLKNVDGAIGNDAHHHNRNSHEEEVAHTCDGEDIQDTRDVLDRAAVDAYLDASGVACHHNREGVGCDRIVLQPVAVSSRHHLPLPPPFRLG